MCPIHAPLKSGVDSLLFLELFKRRVCLTDSSLRRWALLMPTGWSMEQLTRGANILRTFTPAGHAAVGMCREGTVPNPGTSVPSSYLAAPISPYARAGPSYPSWELLADVSSPLRELSCPHVVTLINSLDRITCTGLSGEIYAGWTAHHRADY